MSSNQDASKTQGTTGTKTKAKAPISPVLRTYTIPSALEVLLETDQRHGIIPAAGRQELLTALHAIIAQAEDLGLRHAGDLISEQTAMLKALTGAKTIREPQTTQVADRLHSYRNLMLSLAVVATADFGGDPSGLYQRMAKLKARTCEFRRALTDDEILLARIAAHTMSLQETRSERAAVYAMVEAGMVPRETPHLTLEAFVANEVPEGILAAGHTHLEERFVPLDQFESGILGRFMQDAHSAGVSQTTSLTYSPRTTGASYAPEKHKPGTREATAAAHGLLERMLKEIGLYNGDVTTTSIRLWRLLGTYRAAGATAAQELAGLGTDPMELNRLWQLLGEFEQIGQCTQDDEGISFL